MINSYNKKGYCLICTHGVKGLFTVVFSVTLWGVVLSIIFKNVVWLFSGSLMGIVIVPGYNMLVHMLHIFLDRLKENRIKRN